MKPIYAVVVFLLLVLSSAVSSFQSYHSAKKAIIDDLDRALELTLAQKQEVWITPDTINDYRSFISMPQLRDCAFISYCLPHEQRHSVCGKPMFLRKFGKGVACYGYADCSLATIISLSNKSLPLTLVSLTILWLMFSIFYYRRKNGLAALGGNLGYKAFGGIYYSENEDVFLNLRQEPIHLTPMQLELMKLFFSRSNYQLSKEDICATLWPKKEDASETLYALIKRIRPVLRQNSKLHIDTDRGRCYRLTELDKSGHNDIVSGEYRPRSCKCLTNVREFFRPH